MKMRDDCRQGRAKLMFTKMAATEYFYQIARPVWNEVEIYESSSV